MICTEIKENWLTLFNGMILNVISKHRFIKQTSHFHWRLNENPSRITRKKSLKEWKWRRKSRNFIIALRLSQLSLSLSLSIWVSKLLLCENADFLFGYFHNIVCFGPNSIVCTMRKTDQTDWSEVKKAAFLWKRMLLIRVLTMLKLL